MFPAGESSPITSLSLSIWWEKTIACVILILQVHTPWRFNPSAMLAVELKMFFNFSKTISFKTIPREQYPMKSGNATDLARVSNFNSFLNPCWLRTVSNQSSRSKCISKPRTHLVLHRNFKLRFLIGELFVSGLDFLWTHGNFLISPSFVLTGGRRC